MSGSMIFRTLILPKRKTMIKKVNYLLILIVIINITSGWADMVSNRSSHNTYTTITAALSAAAANDNLDIYKGIYSETVNLTY